MRLPSLKFLKTFQVAAKLKSFKAAAEELFLTPSAVSHQIKALEEQLGVALFERGYDLASRNYSWVKAPPGMETVTQVHNAQN